MRLLEEQLLPMIWRKRLKKKNYGRCKNTEFSYVLLVFFFTQLVVHYTVPFSLSIKQRA